MRRCPLLLVLILSCCSSPAVDGNPDASTSAADTLSPRADAIADAVVSDGKEPDTIKADAAVGQWTNCATSPLGASVQCIPAFNDCSGPEIVELSEAGYVGLAGSLNCTTVNEYFPKLSAEWTKVTICNSLDCLRSRVPGGGAICADVTGSYDYLAYGPERSGGVPPEEQTNIPWAAQQAASIAAGGGKPLMLSFGTEQLHLEALERGFGWNNIGAVVALLAPHADHWMIQSADDWNSNFNKPGHEGYQMPILSQMHFDPGPEWRAEALRWSTALKNANPKIQIWIQLALHKIGPPEDPPRAETLLAYREWLVNPQHGPPVVDGVYISSVYSYPTNAGSQAADQELNTTASENQLREMLDHPDRLGFSL